MQTLRLFIKDSIEEMRYKVTWPKYRDLQNSSVLVLIASMIFALMIGAFDLVFETIMEWFYSAF
jgi:preprotein translocase subunit SecE